MGGDIDGGVFKGESEEVAVIGSAALAVDDDGWVVDGVGLPNVVKVLGDE